MKSGNISQNPLGEVFGFPTTNLSDKAGRYRQKKLCPFNNKVPTKIITPEPVNINEFVSFLQDKLDEKFEGSPPDAPSLKDIMSV